jgi:nicotinate-nucleotide adenylyltransferase
MLDIGICGGTFNPIHNGHLLIAQEAIDKYNLDKVFFIPSGKPPHKKGIEIIDSKHRYNMVIEATKNNNKFEVLDIELNREGYTFTIDTLKEFKSRYQKYNLHYIIGADVVLDLKNWKNSEEIFKICSFIAFLRPGKNDSEVKKEVERLSYKYAVNIKLFETIYFEVSSSNIRNRIINNSSIRYLVQDSVINYINKNNLYKK